MRIRYRNQAGNRSIREITPIDLWERHVLAWCHLRSGQREFALQRIEVVAPA